MFHVPYAFSVSLSSLRDSLSDAGGELLLYFSHMSVLEWGIVSSAAVIFGFLCMRGHDLRK